MTIAEHRAARPLADQAYERLFERIRECELEPRQRISERNLAVELDLGLAPVRAALSRLAAEGIVVPIPRVGYEVRGFTVKDVDDFFQAWRLLAPELVSIAIEKADAQRRAHLAEVHAAAQREAAGMESGRGWVHVAETVFDALIAGVDNALLERFYRELRFDMHRLFVLVFRDEGDGGALTVDRLDQILEGDVPTARAYVERFVDASTIRVRGWAERHAAGVGVASGASDR